MSRPNIEKLRALSATIAAETCEADNPTLFAEIALDLLPRLPGDNISAEDGAFCVRNALLAGLGAYESVATRTAKRLFPHSTWRMGGATGDAAAALWPSGSGNYFQSAGSSPALALLQCVVMAMMARATFN